MDEKALEAEITKFNTALGNMIPDDIERFKMISRMLVSYNNNFEYFGDRHLVMNDFWEGISDEHRLGMLGAMLNPNAMSHFFGRYKEMMLGLSKLVEMFEQQMNDMPADMGIPAVPQEKPNHYQ